MQEVSNKCFICGKPVYDGIIINGERICKECEKKIIKTDPSEEKYSEYKDKIKVILYK